MRRKAPIEYWSAAGCFVVVTIPHANGAMVAGCYRSGRSAEIPGHPCQCAIAPLTGGGVLFTNPIIQEKE
tara:strand:+ start:178 stop:387 length:210 start_codon:yes stop_codon:yes gene_type:complete